MNAKRTLAALLIVAAGPSTAAFGATCLTHRTHTVSGDRVVSPYGVDRTGRASAGWHQGLDIVNNVGKGDPILSGSPGTVSFAYQARGAGNYATVVSGDMKYLYMHMQNVHKELAGKQVQAGDQIGEMGCSGQGSRCAIHLHLGAMMRGSALKASGAAGRVWREGSGKSASNRPLTAEMIKGAMPDSWYLVNPEPFLDHQIAMDPSGNKPAVYGPQMGGWRSQTLPRTCSPDQTVIENPRLASTTGTGSSYAAIDGQASNRSGNEGFAATMAGQSSHGVVLEYAKLAGTQLAQTTNSAAMTYSAQADSLLAHLVLATVNGEGEGR